MSEDLWVVMIQDKTGLFALSHICQFTCLAKLHKSGKFPILSSRPIQWGRMESGVIYCALQLSGGSWPTSETCSSWPLRIWWFYASVGILFMCLQRLEGIRKKYHTDSGLRGSNDYLYKPCRIFRDLVTPFPGRCPQNHQNLLLVDLKHRFLPRFLRLLARPYLVVSNSKTADKDLLLRGLCLAKYCQFQQFKEIFLFHVRTWLRWSRFLVLLFFLCWLLKLHL